MLSKLLLTKIAKPLLIFPHPDDETYVCGGLFQKLNKLQKEYKLIILTKGESSTLRTGLSTTANLGAVREKEFKAVCSYLNISNYSINDYPDGKLKDKEYELYTYLHNEIKTYAPDTLITYEPYGIYGHPDHVILSSIVTDIAKRLTLQLVYATSYPGYRPPDNLKKMSINTNMRMLAPNRYIALSLKEFIKKINTLVLYKSQITASHGIVHQIYGSFKMAKEYYYVNE